MSGVARPSGERLRFAQLDGYRGIAALLIVVHHVYLHSRTLQGAYLYIGTPLHLLFLNLDVAVTWFFVLSGFVIFLPFAQAAVTQKQPVSIRNFLLRRAMRILPVYYVAIMLLWSLHYSGSLDNWRDLVEHLTFTHVFDNQHFWSIIDPAWSLGVEGVFYGFVAVSGPLAYAICCRVNAPQVRALLLGLGCVVLSVVSVTYKIGAYALAHEPLSNASVYAGPLAQLHVFALGMLIAVIVSVADARPVIGRTTRALLQAFAWALLTVVGIFRLTNDLTTILFSSLAGAAFAAMLAASVLRMSRPACAASQRPGPSQFLGIISYSLYLWHKPLLLEITRGRGFRCSTTIGFVLILCSVLCGAILVATISYAAIERPVLRWRRRFSNEHTQAQYAITATGYTVS